MPRPAANSKRPRRPAAGRKRRAPSASEQAHQDVAHLARHLKAHVRSEGRRARHMSLGMGKGKDYLSRAMGGKTPLKVKTLFEVFLGLGEHPRPFFNRLYLLTSDGLARNERDQLRTLRPDEIPRFDDLVALSLSRERIPTAGQGVERARRILKRLIIERETNQRRVSVALGLNPGTLVQALNHGMDLEAWHVFGVLRVVGAEPGAYFRELMGPMDAAAGIVPLGELLPAMQRLVADSASPLREVLAEARPADAAVQPGPKPRAGERRVLRRLVPRPTPRVR